MTFTIAFAWWQIPTVISVLSLALAVFWPIKPSGSALNLDGLIIMARMIPALAIIAIVWIIAAILK